MLLLNMYQFHTSDQRVKPVHISYIVLVLETYALWPVQYNSAYISLQHS